MDPMMAWGIGLIVVAMILLVIELFVPSAGVISVAAVLCALVGVVMIARVDLATGMAAAVILLVLMPGFLIMAIKVWPDTWIARRLTLGDPDAQDHPMTHALADKQQQQLLVGQTGRAMTDLRPVGKCQLGDQTIECLAVGGAIQAGTPVKVVAAEGMNIKVQAQR